MPLIERMRFLGIFSNNLDEFFRVRVAALQRIALIGKRTTTTLGHGVGETFTAVNDRVIELQTRFNEAFDEVESQLANQGIDLMSEDQLDEEQGEFVRSWFDRKVRPHLVPILISDVGVPELKDGAIYHAIALEGRGQAGPVRPARIAGSPRPVPGPCLKTRGATASCSSTMWCGWACRACSPRLSRSPCRPMPSR